MATRRRKLWMPLDEEDIHRVTARVFWAFEKRIWDQQCEVLRIFREELITIALQIVFWLIVLACLLLFATLLTFPFLNSFVIPLYICLLCLLAGIKILIAGSQPKTTTK